MYKFIFSFFVLVFVSFPLSARQPAAIASAHPLATQAGEEVLQAGGNAFDAAVAVTAALAVVEPYSSGIGGGGFWLLHRASDQFEVMLDGRERAPFNAHRDMYLDKQGNVIKDASINGPLSAGIPGVPAALEHLAKHYGLLPLSKSLQPAIRYAREGFPVDEHYQRMAKFRLSALKKSSSAAAVFLHKGQVPAMGYVVKQNNLAHTLSLIAEKGADGFYKGELADKLIRGTNKAGGIWSQKDFNEYTIIERKPIKGEYRGMKITSVAPPSSGGIALVEIMNQLAAYPLEKLSDIQQVHYIVETMRRAYRDRAEYLGDTDFVKVPVARLISKDYAAKLRTSIRPNMATPSNTLPGVKKKDGATDTTHFSIIDHQGNRVAATLSINYPFGSCFVPPGTGVLLNDEMDDFSAKPGVPNVYGLVGAEANAIQPGKRMLSSMSPTFLETKNRLAVIGTPGGSRIITMVLLGALAFHQGESAQAIVDLARYHHQYLPDSIFYEPDAFSLQQIEKMSSMGHSLKAVENTWGNMQMVIWDKKKSMMSAASDRRGLGLGRVIP
ncbi:MAG: gamma-glutamyltransferase [Gammaproteobacteria bacterium]|nr:gamma-glutamyltransferase [Gammaproteobacteria bacterium]MCW8911304.1 gamma-glutamyltransferase [Gammaproteobacteria bacterium]MCW9005336.1 gamma-glutamyltransferase [Gammaproteobacteria bacterium]MCW9056314.1 gamma-glutamyltransferase [Gammaproteobacteria bacterium]